MGVNRLRNGRIITSLQGYPRIVLRALNPARAKIFAREDTLLCKNMGISHVQGNRLASRGGFDTNLSHLDHYRGRDPVRAFGSTKMEHQVMTQVAGTNVSDRRRSEMIRYLNAYTHMPAATTVEMLHGIRRFNGDSERLLRDRARVDPLHQIENRAQIATQESSARYTPSRTSSLGHSRYFTTG